MYAKTGKKKKLVIALTALLLAAALGVGIWFAAQGGGEPVNVYPFMYLGMTEFWGDAQESYGPVSTDKIQTEFLSETQTVTEVKVKDGDKVKKGDILFSFDTTLDSLSLERKRLEVEKIKVQLQAAVERLEESHEIIPYYPPGPGMEEEPDLGEELKDKLYQISETAAYDGSTKEKALICWLQEGTAVSDAILQELYETALKFQTENAKKPKPEEEKKEESSASALPEDPQEQTEATLPPEQMLTIPMKLRFNEGEEISDTLTVGKDAYKIVNAYTYQGKTYWLQQAKRISDSKVLENLDIPAFPQEEAHQAAWKELWEKGIQVSYQRGVAFSAQRMEEGRLIAFEQDASLVLEQGNEVFLMLTSQLQNPPGEAACEYEVTPADGILKASVSGGHLILTGKPEELTTAPVSYTVKAVYTFDDNFDQQRAVEEQFAFTVTVAAKEDVKKAEFYVVFKVTEKNFQKGVPTVWQGAKILVYEDGSFGMVPFDASALEDHTLPPPEEVEIELPTIDPEHMYTGEEIKEMQKQLTETIHEQKEKLKMAEAEYKIMERELGDGNVYADIDGKVVSLLTEEEARQNKQPLVKVSGGGGFYIEGSVSELEKEKLKLGQEVTINDWNTGNTYTGEVKSIGDFPTDEDSWNGLGNPTASYYPFRAFVDEEADLQAGTYVSMTYSAASAEHGVYLEKAFVRTEQGRNYIFAMGDGGRLEKREVKVGKVLWGSYYEILSGLSEEDLLAFPYGKNVKDGAPAVESDISTLYTY